MARPKASRGSTTISDYKNQLQEKQKAKLSYNIRERQLKRYMKAASKAAGATGERLLQLLETRLDNVVARLGLGPTRPAGRQLISHKKILVNGRVINIPSYQTKKGDEIELVDKNQPLFEAEIPAWLKLDKKRKQGKVVKIPLREEIITDIDESLIVEYYSR